MISVNNFSTPNYITFRGNGKNAQASLEHSLERLKNNIIAEEKAMTAGALKEEVVNSIEEKFNRFLPRILKINPKYIPELQKPLDEAVLGRYDITDSYIALGDFEKRLSQIKM